VSVPEVQGTTQEVAIAKCKAAAEKVSRAGSLWTWIADTQLGAACVTEDTALCFEALGGLPGPYIKDFLGKLGHEGWCLLVAHISSCIHSIYCSITLEKGCNADF
jgi:inosine triphosphate pyrophosphatase